MTAHSSVTPVLTAEPREALGRKVKALRRSGLVPAVVYGHKQDAKSLAIEARALSKVYHEAGMSTLVDLKVGSESTVKVLIHDIQLDPRRREITHVDFFAVNLKEKLRTEVPLSFTGVSDAVEMLGGTLIHVKDYVEVECLPSDLVHEIEVDLTTLKTFEDSITVADLPVPTGIVILDDAEQTLVSVAEPRSEEELAALDEVPDATVETEFETEDGVKEGETPEEGSTDEA